MNIAFITSEAYPFIKTGGLADVSYSLPRALAERGHDVRLFLPRYYRVGKDYFSLKPVGGPLGVPFGGGEKWGALFESGYVPGIVTYFIEHEAYFGRDGLYDDGYNAYSDNGERFAFFARAVMQAMKALDFLPDIIHCNDWQTGLVPVHAKTTYGGDPFFRKAASIITVHNVGYQGVFDRGVFSQTHLPWEHFSPGGLEYYGQINFLKGGIHFSDAVTTVSRKYAMEIQREEFGYNLAGVFSGVCDRLYGITNAVDYGKWDPSADPYIPARYSSSRMEGKAFCKGKLQHVMELDINPSIPIVGIITRLTYQKGVDVLLEALEEMIPGGTLQFVMLGTGEEWLIQRFQALRDRHQGRVGVFWGYSEEHAHLIEAGSDIYVMPSRYEPCGLNQMYSLKYGTIPVVRATGGLDDTVTQWDAEAGTGNGFKFSLLEHDVVRDTLYAAMSAFKNKVQWRQLQQNAMAFHYSWDDAVSEYETVYDTALRIAGGASDT
ncbi:MAG TPA: glycogen synthase GlgA [Spirochaetota bacterium]|nr:glycogen synthase GlgA [Spirochaetota bacterium]